MYDVPEINLLAILKEGAANWNDWRIQNPDIPAPDLHGADLNGADLSAAMLNGAILNGANLFGADLSGADLSGADLGQTDLSQANLSGADLRQVNLGFANLSGANIHGADLSRAELSGADLRQANINGADLTEAVVSWTIFGDIDLSVAKGLESVRHLGPSTIGIDTIYRSNGQIPEVFLLGAGVPDAFITYVKSLVGQPIEFDSCFLSCSSKDKEFAERLHADLQSKGVRCWFAPEDLKIGDKFRSRIDESIRIFDKLMLILSQDSITSPWVEDEVEAALERERRESRLVLFPVRLDDAIMQTDVAWAAHLRQKRHIGDFSEWQQHPFYRKAFDRLLRDLKAREKPPTDTV
jgi:TIR domain/Pentapeptide repeats (8 copies)